jgi:hypothetical protein
VQRGARWALGAGAALIAMAAITSACAGVHFVDLDQCSADCPPPAANDAAAGDESAEVILSLPGGRAPGNTSGAHPDLILDAAALPSVLVSGPPSPIASAGAQPFNGPGVSPYAFFQEVIAAPLSPDTQNGDEAAALFLFAPSLIGRLTFTDFLSNSSELFKPPPPFIPPPGL